MIKGFLSKLSEFFFITGYSGLKLLIRSVNCLVTSLWVMPSWEGLQNQNEMMPKCYSDICTLAISIKNLFSSVSLVRLIKTKIPIQFHVMLLWRIYSGTKIVVTFSIVSISLNSFILTLQSLTIAFLSFRVL